MRLILDTLDAARLTAATPAQAMALQDAMRDVEALASAGEDLEDIPGLLATLAALHAHVARQPFDTSDDPLVTETTPGAFAEWLGELERLAG